MAELTLDNSVAIVTGAGRGMGAATARELARRGARVIVNDIGTGVDGSGEDNGPAHEVAEEIVAAGGSAVPDNHSVTTTEGAEAIVQTALDSFGRCDIVVNNAGILNRLTFLETDLQDFTRHLSVHLMGSFNVSHAAWPHMLRTGYGRIVFITSSAMFGSSVSVSYSAAKAGQIGLMRTLALAGRESGIKVNGVAPVADTRMTGGPGDPGPDQRPARPPERVAQAIALLAHESCPVTGEIIGVGGDKADRVLLAATHGYASVDRLTTENLLEHWEQVIDTGEWWLPQDSFDHVARMTNADATPDSEDLEIP
jgi:NAD(P)-dependent dehydrogenase (short-subunit alcohol dehydrogenase family)